VTKAMAWAGGPGWSTQSARTVNAPGARRGSQGRRTCDGTLAPICGCDGMTYTSMSCAYRAGVRPDYAGECVTTDD